MVTKDLYYVLVNKETNRVEGYSSSSNPNGLFLEVEVGFLEDDLKNHPFSYIYKNSKFILDEKFKNEAIKKRASFLTDIQKLGQKNSDLEIELICIRALVGGGAIPLIVAKETMIEDWKKRLNMKWATKAQLMKLVQIGYFTEIDVATILGGKL